MLYPTLRWMGRVALHWFYRDIAVEGLERVPADAPLLVVSNHPNQLIDALLVGTSFSRDITFTGKAILLDNPVMRVFMGQLPFVPLRRAHDERAKMKAERGTAGTGDSGSGTGVASPSRATADAGSRVDSRVGAGAPPQLHHAAGIADSRHRNDAAISASSPGGPPRVHHGAEDAGMRHPSAAAVSDAPPVVALTPDLSRNDEAFRAIHDALAARKAVLIFPEGISHHRPQLAPIKTGAARIALQARDARGIRDLHIVPVGLNFEDKAEPRTRVLVRIGTPMAMDGWQPDARAAGGPVEQLTRAVDEGLRAVTLNFTDEADRQRVLEASRLLAELFAEPRPLAESDLSLAVEQDVARRAERVRGSLDTADEARRARVARFEARLAAFGAELARQEVPVRDLAIDLGTAPAARFVVREGARMLAAAPLALWGRVNHWIPLHLARAIARRTSRTPEDPAMHTIVVGLTLVLLFYVLQGALVWWLAGPWWAAAYVVSLPVSATWDFRLRDLAARARQRVRTYLRLRRDAALRERLRGEMEWLRGEASEIENGD